MSTAKCLPLPLFIISFVLKYTHTHSVLSALISSGAASKNMDHGIAEHILLREITGLIELNTIDRPPIGTGFISHSSPLLCLCVSCLYHKQISFHIMDPSKHPLILGYQGYPGFTNTTPIYPGPQGSDFCHQNCLFKPSLLVESTSIERPDSAFSTDSSGIHRLPKGVQ